MPERRLRISARRRMIPSASLSASSQVIGLVPGQRPRRFLRSFVSGRAAPRRTRSDDRQATTGMPGWSAAASSAGRCGTGRARSEPRRDDRAHQRDADRADPIQRENCADAVAAPIISPGLGVLNDHDERLHHQADADTEDRDVPDHLGSRRVGAHRREQGEADGHERRPGEQDRPRAAGARHDLAGDHARPDPREHEGRQHGSGPSRALAENALHEQRDERDRPERRRAEREERDLGASDSTWRRRTSGTSGSSVRRSQGGRPPAGAADAAEQREDHGRAPRVVDAA